MLGLSSMADEKDLKARALFPVRVPVPFIKKMRYGDINDPLLLQVMPRHQEFIAKTGFDKDPLKEQKQRSTRIITQI